MPPKFDPDTALKADLQDAYHRLQTRYDRLKKKAAKQEAEFEAAAEAAAAAARRKAKKVDPAVNASIDEMTIEVRRQVQRNDRLKSHLVERDETIADYVAQLEGLLATSAPRTLVKAILKPGLRHYDPDVALHVQLIIDNSTREWVGIETCGYGQYKSTTTIFPFALKGERLDFGEGFEGERDGRLLIKGKPIEKGTMIPFFPTGEVKSTGDDLFIVESVLPVMHGATG